MENRVDNSDDVEIPKKNRSLDVQSLYKSKVIKEGKNHKLLKRKRSLQGGDDGDHEGEGRRKKKSCSRKEASLSSFEHVGKKNKKSLDEVYSGPVLSPGSQDSGKTQLGSSQKLDNDSSTGLSQKLNCISLSLDDNVIRIPKRKRGFARRKKFDSSKVLEPAGPSSSVADVVDYATKSTGDSASLVDSGTWVESLKVNSKKHFDNLKENKSSGSKGSNSARKFKKENDSSIVQDGDSSSRKPQKPQKSRRKRNDLAKDSRRIGKEAGTSMEKSVKICNDFQEDDEDNLEQNAARMLSSRFDPSCTGFSPNRKASASFSSNGLSLLMSSGRDSVSRRQSSFDGSESVDAAGMVLRPRKQHKERGLSRKRRHFYEIFSKDLDAYWVLNRRIKVFWPLDQSWYFGLVSDYDPDRKLHHVKYDDRDEEWINLQNERYKLLLFSSEVPGKADKKNCAKEDKSAERNGDVTKEDDIYMGSYMDSEPIISWLARSTHRVKSPTCATKKQKTSSHSSDLVGPLLPNKTVNSHGCLDVGSLEKDNNKLSSNSALPDSLNDAGRRQKSVLESSTCHKDTKPPIVYVRRRFRHRGPESSYVCKGNLLSWNASGSGPSLAPVVDGSGILDEHDISLRRSDYDWSFWCIDNLGLLKLNIPLIASRRFRLELSFPVPVLDYASGVGNSWLFHSFLMHQYGTVMIMWPNIQLEMLFVDNIVGLRFFLFEGCLKQAVACIFLVLSVFHKHMDQGKYFDLQLPVTSISFKFSCSQKELVFAFYGFFKVKSSKWLYLDRKLKRHCLLTKQLPLSECTYDNIKVLQSGTNQLLSTSVYGNPSPVKVSQRRSKRGIIRMGASKESAYVNMGQSSSSYKEKRQFPPIALSFTAAPTFFLSLHLQLLMEHSVALTSFPDHDSVSLQEDAEYSGRFMPDYGSPVEDFFNRDMEITPGNRLRTSSGDAVCSRLLSFANSDGSLRRPFLKYQNGEVNGVGTSCSSQDPVNNGIGCIVQLQNWRCRHSESEQLQPRPLVLRDLPSQGKSDSGCYSSFNGITVEIPPFNQVEDPVNGEPQSAHRSTDLSWNMNDGLIRSPNPTAPRSVWHRSRNSSSSSPFGYPSHVWSEGKAEFYRNGFNSGPKKPRTQVSYTLPFGGFDINSKDRSSQQKGLSHKRIRRANEKRTSDGSRSSQRNLEVLSCVANVLITLGDRGWREFGAQVVLELFDHNEWRLAVKLSGTTKYSYKANQVLLPGSTNRHTHALMWKGGKDWILEFTDRSQWALFREMHEECYNRNIRAALVKNIPIPGVRLLEEIDDIETEAAFVRNSPKYFRQVESDVEMALDPSRILYDMDSDDEQWMLKNQNSLEINGDISEELFERTMDLFEKLAYAQQRDLFTSDEIDELMVGIGPRDVIKTIYEYWRQKRQRKGMPLIRHLQPPLWERYQHLVKEWELSVNKTNGAFSNGGHGKAAPNEKPPMFAFCLKPRGLEVPNKGSKQRSQRRFSVSGQSHADHDGYHSFGRRMNGFAYGDEKVVYQGHSHSHDYSDTSPLVHTQTRVFSPRDASNVGYFSMSSDGIEKNHHPHHHPKFNRTKSKKISTFLPSPPHTASPSPSSSYNQRTIIGKRNGGVQRWNTGIPEWPSQKNFNHQPEMSQRHFVEQLDSCDFDEFRLRDASSAAQHALNMAKLKRENAQRLLYRADISIHKAVVALMTAEAIKASSEDINGDG